MHLLKEEDDLETEQAAMDEHEDRVRNLGDRLLQLVLQEEPGQKELTDPQPRGLHRCLALIIELRDISEAVETLAADPGLYHCLLKQYEEQISSLKLDFMEVSHRILMIDDGNPSLADKRSVISKAIFNTHLQIW